jgi:hypothetical protein
MNDPSHVIDERFLMHRLRSTSAAAMAGGVLAMGLFAYRYYFQHVPSWDLLAVGMIMAATKQGFMLWYRVTQ